MIYGECQRPVVEKIEPDEPQVNIGINHVKQKKKIWRIKEKLFVTQ